MNTRILTTVRLAAILILLVTLLPTTAGTAQGNQQYCPPPSVIRNLDLGFDKTLLKECLQLKKPISHTQFGLDSQIIPLASGGPDDYGYTFDDTVSYSWISASNDTGLTGDDNSSSLFGIGFDFPFYGYNYSQLYFSTNGLITFDQEYLWYGGDTIPNTGQPNNYIAPFWEDFVVGSPDNSGGIYYEMGGVSPNQYLVLEWRDITTYSGSDPFSFEVVLYENGDILVQHQSLPTDYYSTVGIENSIGDDGLGYQAGVGGLSAPKAIKFFYPTTPTARLLVSPLSSGKFASTSADTNFPLTITNNGSAGADTYDLSATSSWSVSLFQDGCITPLTDTDTDTKIDTGSLAEGASITICVKFTPPGGLDIGDENSASLTVTSSLNVAKTKNITFDMAIPASFTHVFEDYTDAAMAFRVVQPTGLLTNYVTNDLYYGDGPATIGLPDDRYIYVWNKTDNPNAFTYSDIEFTFVSDDGTTSTPVEKLTSNVNNDLSMDFAPSVAVTPDGTIGVVWYRFLANDPGGGSFVYNFNIYFATISATGSLLTGPTNITNNTLWDDYDDINVPHFRDPVIAGTDDNHFVLSWDDYRTDGAGTYLDNIWYSTFESNGALVFSPTALTTDGESRNPILNSLSNGNVILTWNTLTFLNPGYSISPYYTVINSNGTIVKSGTALDTDTYYSPYTDAVLLPNGNIAITLAKSNGVALFIVDENYNIVSGPHYASTPNQFNVYISTTYDPANRIIMTWHNDDNYPSTELLYALADDTGTFLTSPIPFRNSAPGILVSENGQGNAPFILPDVMSITRANANPTSATSVDFIVTFSENVTGVDTSDFSLATTGVSGASISSVTDTGDQTSYTVTVNTGSGNGTIRLDVVDDNSIIDAASNPLGGANLGDGNYTSGEVYTITINPTFGDVPFSHPYYSDIEILYANGYTGGCSTSPLMFCPDVSMSRAQSAVFMLRGNFGNSYVPVTPTHFFKDNWKNSSWGEGWAESMYLEGLTAGCSPSPLKFCPDEILTNVQLAVFGLRLKHGMAYPTPTATGTVFADMTDTGFWGTGWAEQAYVEGLIPSCGTDVGTGLPKFCPNALVSRGFGASVIVNAKNLTMP